MKVYCKTCGITLTRDLALYEGKCFNEADGQNYINPGFYTISDGEYFTASENCVIVNTADVFNLENHLDESKLHGCCGMAGTDGPNKICINGHEVATEKSDCWMAHAIIFETDKTILK